MKHIHWIILVSFLGAIVLGCSGRITQDHVELNDLGVAQMGRFEYAAAYETFAEVVAQRPKWDLAQVNLAIAILNTQEEGAEQQALDILGNVLHSDPENVRAIYTSGVVSFHLGHITDAHNRFKRVVSLDPEDAYAAYFLGQTHLQLQEYKDAKEWLIKSIELDPYLVSGYWAAALAARRMNDPRLANQLLEDYQRLEANPAARTASISYLKMGPKANARSANVVESQEFERPKGPLFGSPTLLKNLESPIATMAAAWRSKSEELELFVADKDSIRWFTLNPTASTLSLRHTMGLQGTVSLHIGDVDNDSNYDLVVCSNQGLYWLKLPENGVAEVSPDDRLWSGSCNSAVLVDADHDGDLDIMFADDGIVFQLTNTRTTEFTFREIALVGARPPIHEVLATDLDSDRDVDLLFSNKDDPIYAARNDRTWRYRQMRGIVSTFNEPLINAVSGDIDVDGYPDIVAHTIDSQLTVLSFDRVDWRAKQLDFSLIAGTSSEILELALSDVTGSGELDLIVVADNAIHVVDIPLASEEERIDLENLVSAIPVYTDASMGPGLVAATRDALYYVPPGEGRFKFLAIDPVGERDASQMRSNASGIGTRVKLRVGGSWSIQDRIDNHSGASQSLLPLSFGLRGLDAANNVVLEWSDGVFQTEIGLSAGNLHRISEVERQLASCPVLFAWNGTEFEFVSDVLGVGGSGFFSPPGQSVAARPWERFRMNSEQLKPRDGRYAIKIGEPMEETLYLDASTIEVVDLPPQWNLVVDERMSTGSPVATGRLITFREQMLPSIATTADGRDITDKLLDRDLQAPDPGSVDKRFIGRLEEYFSITMWFESEIPSENQVLVADGWIEYPYSQTVFGAWQAGAEYGSPTIEALDGESNWVVVLNSFGYPAGMPREMVVPLPTLPEGTKALRITSNLEIYWDRIRLVTEESAPPEMVVQTLQPVIGKVQRSGFAHRTTGDQRLPFYDYQNRSQYWDAKYMTGFYSAYGDALALVNEVDGAYAIIGSGEEVHLEFSVPESPTEGYSRHLILDFRGWARDMDLYTQFGDTVEPLPRTPGMDRIKFLEGRDLHVRQNVRFERGM